MGVFAVALVLFCLIQALWAPEFLLPCLVVTGGLALVFLIFFLWLLLVSLLRAVPCFIAALIPPAPVVGQAGASAIGQALTGEQPLDCVNVRAMLQAARQRLATAISARNAQIEVVNQRRDAVTRATGILAGAVAALALVVAFSLFNFGAIAAALASIAAATAILARRLGQLAAAAAELAELELAVSLAAAEVAALEALVLSLCGPNEPGMDSGLIIGGRVPTADVAGYISGESA